VAKQNRFGQSTPFDKESFKKVRDSFRNDSHRLIFCLGWYTTERWGAILKLQVSHCYDERGQPRRSLVIPGNIRKDGATRDVPVSRSLAQELKAYRSCLEAQYRKIGVQMLPGDWLFPSLVAPGQHLTFRAADRALRRALKRCDLHREGFSTHSTRRGSITEMANAGLAVPVIRSITGHRSLASLGKYIDVSEHQRCHALSVLE
jgi:integrase/recombinase XerD